jgi:hypothetical protein
MKLLAPASAVVAAAALIAAGGCAHLSSGGVAPATPTPVASATGSAAPCLVSAAANAQIVVISPLLTPVVDPTYGLISGYGPVNNGNANNVASTIVVTPSTTIQFFNDDASTSQLRYSAVGIPNVTAFPSPAYTFPPAAAEQTGTQINATSSWSTGLLPGQCYSQTFTIAGSGTYFFGDETYYGLANLRDVIVATASPASSL